MALTRLVLWLMSRIVPAAARQRWLEEWTAESRYGGRRMLPGALPDAWALRALARNEAASPPRPSLFHALDQDVRYALRTFGAGRSFAIGVIGSLAIGIGVTTLAFSLVNASMFRPLPEIRAEEELVQVQLGDRPTQGAWFQTAWADFEVLRDGITAVDDLSIAHEANFAVAPGGEHEPRTSAGLIVSSNYFDVLGARSTLGRFFRPEEDAAPWGQPAVVISHNYWQRYLAGDSNVLQRTLNVNGADLPIIGVAPEGFSGIYARSGIQIWVTFALSDLVFRDAAGRPIAARDAPPFRTTIVGRLKPSATIQQGQAQAAGLAPALAGMRERGIKRLFVRVQPLRIVEPTTDAVRALALMAVPLIVLAIACVNAANLLLARATRRSGDWLVRLALGASRWRLIRQLLVESLLLALGGAALGLVLCFWARSFVENQVVGEILIDGNVLLFVLAAAIATALIFGLGPALSVTRAAVSRAPEAGRFMRGPFGSRTRSALVMLQAALCIGLLATGAQFTKTLQTLWDDGLPEPEQFLAVSIDVDQLRYDRKQSDAFYDGLLARVQELPQVEAAALTNGTVANMLTGLVTSRGGSVSAPGSAGGPIDGTLMTYTTAGFFETMGLPLVAGRTFVSGEHRDLPRSVIVNQAFVARAFGQDPLGRVVRLTTGREGGERTSVDTMVVGVFAPPEGQPIFSQLPNVFYPGPLIHEPARDLLVRFNGDAGAVSAAIRTIVATMDARLPIGLIATGEDLRRRRNVLDYTLAQTVTVLGVIALMLAAAGLYGVVSYMVTLRQKEIGIRIALGAEGASVLKMIVRQSIVPVLVGCVLGSAGAVVVAFLVRSRLHGVSQMDPASIAGAALLLLVTMVVASLVPARRAARVDPIQVLRTE
ncbi:MAG: ADOP family duplicated permease [Acidobacteriota bacterium]|nr:ABC transporter permease [Acidobacteriota bacterium]MDQ3419135.1 ADOP family duplicated permease [Acidobacteriota bacterium]